MSQEKTIPESAFMIESDLNPMSVIEKAAQAANVRGKVGYALHFVCPQKWKVTLTNGTIEDLKKAIRMSQGVKIVETK